MADTLSSESVCLRKSATPSSSSELVSTSLRLRLPLRCQRLIPPAHASIWLRASTQRALMKWHRPNSSIVVCCGLRSKAESSLCMPGVYGRI